MSKIYGLVIINDFILQYNILCYHYGRFVKVVISIGFSKNKLMYVAGLMFQVGTYKSLSAGIIVVLTRKYLTVIYSKY